MSVFERRRESRIPGSAAEFCFENFGCPNSFQCRVVNLSHLGLGVEIPASAPEQLQKLGVGDQIAGRLRIGVEELTADLVVRVRRENFVGMEYVSASLSFVSNLRKLLSPSYISASIYEVASEILAPGIERAFRGDDFECILFKGIQPNSEKIQIFLSGYVVSFHDTEVHFTPPPFVRASSKYGGFDVFGEFSSFHESGTSEELQNFLRTLQTVLNNWPTCPEVLKQTITTHLK